MLTHLAFPDLPDAACVEYDPETFFPTSGETIKQADAKRICGTCTARDACLEFALTAMAHGETIDGTWGATSPTERMRMLKDRTGVTVCRNRLHARTPENITPTGKCRPCQRANEQRYYERERERERQAS